jgi:hypothetical protein
MGGDHPVIWANKLYIFMGHNLELLQNSAFTTIFHKSILWAAHQ